ncbi:amidohydrolase family protein [Diaphorobacter ruginosibacter]|uniref:amidohydrolase family protein n=1 Tax=Diaphorobacter ruginosibacter TaxID=1715720 RepID=UPI0033427791
MYVSREVVKEALRLNAAAVAFSHMRTRWVRDRQHGLRLPLEHTVKKQAMETTGIYGMRDRGQLKPGYLADVNIIDFDRLRLPPPYVAFDLPAGGA